MKDDCSRFRLRSAGDEMLLDLEIGVFDLLSFISMFIGSVMFAAVGAYEIKLQRALVF